MTEKELKRIKSLTVSAPEVSWERNVLVGCLRERSQLRLCLQYRFYHMPADRMEGEAADIKWVAIYQSQNLFGHQSGVRWYGRVVDCKLVKRSQIGQISRDSDTPYYLFTVARWEKRRRKIVCKELPITHIRTTEFLLKNAMQIPELMLEDARQYCLYHGLKKLLRRRRVRTAGFWFEDSAVVVKRGEICTLVNGKLQASYLQEHFAETPYIVLKHIFSQIL